MTPWQKIAATARENQAKYGGDYAVWFNRAAEANPPPPPAHQSKAEIANIRAIHSRQEAAARKTKLRSQLGELVKAEMKNGWDYDQAYSRCHKRFEFANELDTPVFSPQMANLMFLSTNADQAECAAAYAGNGGKLSPLDHRAVAQGLTDHYKKTLGLSAEGAAKQITQAHPRLADALDTLQK